MIAPLLGLFGGIVLGFGQYRVFHSVPKTPDWICGVAFAALGGMLVGIALSFILIPT